MSDNNRNFHQSAIKSALFKGRSDWYFCFLKSERIAHVLVVLADSVLDSRQGELLETSRVAGILPKTILHFAAGEVDPGVVLADLFSLVSSLRLLQTGGAIAKENAEILVQEYEALIEKFAASVHLSPFASVDDFAVPHIEQDEPPLLHLLSGSEPRPRELEHPIKDTKGHLPADPSSSKKIPSKEQQSRLQRILDFVLQNKSVSVKDIAAVVRDCSEKTIQRELGVLIQQGAIKKVGERRWSLYMPR